MTPRIEQQDAHARWSEFERDELISQIRVHVYCAYRSTLGPDWRSGSMQDGKNRLYYVVSGTGEVSLHGENLALAPGGLYLIPAHTPHGHACSSRLVLYWCHFSAETRYGTPLFDCLSVPFACDASSARGSGDMLAAMTRLYEDDSPGAVIQRSGLLLQALSPFLERADFSGWRLWHHRAEAFQPVLDVIDRRLAETLSVDELARTVHLSRCYFLSRFKKLFGVSPHQYHMRKRIEQARVRLLQTSDTIEHIGGDLGFADPFHFSRLFKKITGLSPQAFRLKHDAGPTL